MQTIPRSTFALVAAWLIALSSAAPAFGAQLLTNGGFETGDFTGWTVTDQLDGSGSFFVTGAASTPLSGLATVGPLAGAFYAVSDQTGPGTHALIQLFTVPAGSSSVSLSFNMFVNDQNGLGPIVNPGGLDFNATPNQHGRVDILTAAATPFGGPAPIPPT